MKDANEDTRLVEAANFTHSVKFAAHSAVASLRYLKELSRERGIPMAKLQPSHVVEDLKREDQKQRPHRMETARLMKLMIALPHKKPNQSPQPMPLTRHG